MAYRKSELGSELNKQETQTLYKQVHISNVSSSLKLFNGDISAVGIMASNSIRDQHKSPTESVWNNAFSPNRFVNQINSPVNKIVRLKQKDPEIVKLS